MTWPTKVFSSLYAESSRNGLTKPKRVRGSGYKFINMKEIFAYDRMNNIPCEYAPLNEKEKQTSLLQENDLLFARQSLVLSGAGKCSIFLGDDEPTAFESHLIRVRLNKSLTIPAFYYYYFSSPHGRNLIFSIVEQGAGQSGIRGSDLSTLEVPFPDKIIQENIAQVFETLDNKIELNREMNETLEAMAQAIFKDWFVDFGPVMRKLSGTTDPVKILGGLISDPNKAAPIAALFPNSFRDDGLPEGWAYQTLQDILTLSYGKSLPKRSRIPGQFPVYGSGGSNGTHNASLVNGPGIIIGRKGTVGSLYWENEDFFPIDTVFYVQPEPGFSLVYIWHLLKTLGLEKMNTDAAVPGLNRNNAYRLEMPRSSDELVEAYSNLCQPLRDKINANQLENKTLAKTRDYLLPKLMSGSVRVV